MNGKWIPEKFSSPVHDRDQESDETEAGGFNLRKPCFPVESAQAMRNHEGF
jgi:hypothetical protein